jgi:hypothetical protein
MTVQTQTRSARRVAASKGVAVKTNAEASRFVAAYLEGVKGVEDANSALAGAKLSALAVCVAAVKGVPAVSQSDWDRTWKEPTKLALLASGRYQEKSVPPKVAALGVVVMGLTNGIAPREGDTFKLYEDYARQQLAKRGLREVKAQGGGQSGAGKASKAAAKADKAAKAEQTAYMAACERLAALASSVGGVETRAKNLALVLVDQEARDEFWSLVAEIADDVRARDQEEAKTSRRRKAA